MLYQLSYSRRLQPIDFIGVLSSPPDPRAAASMADARISSTLEGTLGSTEMEDTDHRSRPFEGVCGVSRHGARLSSARSGLRKTKTPPGALRRIERGDDDGLMTHEVPVVDQGRCLFANEPAGIAAVSPP